MEHEIDAELDQAVTHLLFEFMPEQTSLSVVKEAKIQILALFTEGALALRPTYRPKLENES